MSKCNHKNRLRCCQSLTGFTVTELLVVIIVLGILAAVIYPNISRQAEKSRVAEAVGILNTIRQGEKAYFLDKGMYRDNPTTVADWAQLGMDTPTGKYFTYAVSAPGVNPQTFTATATRNSTAAATGDVGTTVTINENGTYGGTHPFRPT